jgi:hypothetical protein
MKKIVFITILVFCTCKTSQFNYDSVNSYQLPATISNAEIQQILRAEAFRKNTIVVFKDKIYVVEKLDSILKTLANTASINIKKDSIPKKQFIIISSKR